MCPFSLDFISNLLAHWSQEKSISSLHIKAMFFTWILFSVFYVMVETILIFSGKKTFSLPWSSSSSFISIKLTSYEVRFVYHHKLVLDHKIRFCNKFITWKCAQLILVVKMYKILTAAVNKVDTCPNWFPTENGASYNDIHYCLAYILVRCN